MTLSDLASIASIISGGAVLVSLVYLSFQTRQNTKHTKALIHQGRVEIVGGHIGQLASNPALMAIMMRASEGDQTLDDVQAAQYVYNLNRLLFNTEDLFLQHREGLIDDNRHAGTINRTRQMAQSPGFRAAWKMLGSAYDADYQAFMNGLMNDVRPTASSNAGAIWKNLVAAELSQMRA